MNNLDSYVKETSSKKAEYYFSDSNITVFLKEQLPEHISVEKVFKKIQSVIPNFLLSNLDIIYIGQFDILVDKGVNALYSDGAIYMTNDQDDHDDMLDDIVHELAHSLEENYSMEIYADQELEIEFLGKRRRLANIIKNNDFNISGYNFLQPEYSPELDSFFYKEVGYPLLSTLSRGLFYSPYAATSLREYFANGFESFYLGDRNYLKQLSPKLYNKIYSIHEMGEQ